MTACGTPESIHGKCNGIYAHRVKLRLRQALGGLVIYSYINELALPHLKFGNLETFPVRVCVCVCKYL